MTVLGNLQKLRPCGRLETYSTARHHLGYYNNVALAASYTSTLPPQSLRNLIYAALKVVIAKHPTLSAIPLSEDKSYPEVYFARLPSIDLRKCVEFRERKNSTPKDGEDDEELDQLLMDHHNWNFKADLGTKPFWRLAVLTSSTDQSTFTAAWVFHHALSDGASAFLFHDTFLAALNTLKPDVDADPVVESPITPLPPPFEEQHPMTITWPFFLHTLAKTFLPSLFDKRPAKLWTGNDVPAEITSAPHFNSRTYVLSSDRTKRLAQLSRKQGVSVTATLQALLAATIFANSPAEEADTIKMEAPIAMRPFLKDVPNDEMTYAIASYEVTHHRPSAAVAPERERPDALKYFSWAEAQAVKSAIQAAVAKAGCDNFVALLKYVSNMHDLFVGDLGKPRAISAELSNVGVYKAKSKGAWSIGRMTLSQCANPVTATFHINVVTGGDGNATLNVDWCDGAVEEELLREMMNGFKEGIEALVEGGDV
jgi:hypothetical protein